MARPRRPRLDVEGGLAAGVRLDGGEETDVASAFRLAVRDRGRRARLKIGRELPIESDDPAVERLCWDLADRLERDRARQARDAQPIRPLWKPAPRLFRTKEGKVLCPTCANRPGEVEACPVCDTTGLVWPEGFDA